MILFYPGPTGTPRLLKACTFVQVWWTPRAKHVSLVNALVIWPEVKNCLNNLQDNIPQSFTFVSWCGSAHTAIVSASDKAMLNSWNLLQWMCKFSTRRCRIHRNDQLPTTNVTHDLLFWPTFKPHSITTVSIG